MALIKKFRIKSFKNPQPIISLDNISLSFGNRKILDNVSFKINHGQILGMLGPNGVGKSTIFNLITGLIKPDYGKINFRGTVVNDYPIYLRTTKFKIGYVPQYGGYFGDLTLLENLKAIAEIVILEKELIKNKIDQLIAKFELDAIRDTKAKYLSGGQKKKLVIALALLSDPKILLLDEPFSSLDKPHHDQLVTEVREILKKAGVTSILVTHDESEADMFADKIGKIEKKQLLVV